MKCPYCSSTNSIVTDKRESPLGIRRRRECQKCGKRFTTYEKVEKTELYVIKKDKRREKFSREKLEKGIEKAFEKRPVPREKITRLIDSIVEQLYKRGRREIKSSIIGVGLNINQQNFPDDLPHPVSLIQVMERKFSLKKEFEKLSGCLDFRYRMLREEKTDKINRDYHEKLYRLKEFNQFKTEDQQFTARIIGVSDFGQLILEDKDGKTLQFDFKEVEFVL